MDKKVCIIVSSLMTAKAFLLDYISALIKKNHVTIIANTDEVEFFNNIGLHVQILPVRIERPIMPLLDLRALFHLMYLFRKHRFDFIHSITPKAGLLAMTAGFIVRTPVRIHTFTGQIWATRRGLERWVLKQADRLIASLATNILVDSISQKTFLVHEGVVSESKANVLANGSICGVDTERFRFDENARSDIRAREGIHKNDIVLLYIGRLNKDKGLLDLARAYSVLCKEHENVHLMIVGPDEENIQFMVKDICNSCSCNLHFSGYTSMPECYMSAADIICLPSYREGFGNVIIEGACVGIPAIGSRIYGITDAIDEGVTGLLYEVGDVEDLSRKMKVLLASPELIKKMGEAARNRAIRYFSKETLTSAMIEYCEDLV
jgi:glycosyltransferase involved in cell wall biosynthesis